MATVDPRGSFDGVIGRMAYGWVLDLCAPDRPLALEVLDRTSGRVLGAGLANQPRDDLLRLGIGNGRCAFRIVLSEYPQDAAELAVRLAGRDVLLPLDTSMCWPRAPLPATGMQPWSPDGSRQQGDADASPVLLVLSLIDWAFRFQRPQQLCLALRRQGYGIVHVDASFHGADWRDAAGSPLPACQLLQPGLLRVALAQPPAAPVSIAADLDPADQDWLAGQLQRLVAVCADRPLLVLVLHPGWYPLVRRACPEVPLMYDCMDLFAGFPETTREHLVQEEQLLRHCRLAVASSATLYHRLPPGRRALVRNGCDLAHFGALAACDSFQRWPLAEVRRRYRAVVGYYGAIASWFAIELLADVARWLPDHLFMLGGSSEGCDLSPAAGLDNVVFLGELPYGELPSFLACCAVAIIPFRLDPLIQATNPVKLYEYLAAGKPVVATPLPELQRLKLTPACCRLAGDAAAFAAAIRAMVSADGPDLQAKRRRYASRHSWQQRAQCYDAILKGLLAPTSAVKAGERQAGAEQSGMGQAAESRAAVSQVAASQVPDAPAGKPQRGAGRKGQAAPWPQLLRQALAAADWPVAEGVLHRLLEQSPGHAAHLDLLGYALFMQGRYGASERVLRQALAAGSRQFWTPHKLGDALRAQQRHGEAIEAYEQALAWGSDSPLTVRNLLLACAQDGDAALLQRLESLAGPAASGLAWSAPAPWQTGAMEACLQLGSSVLAAWLVERGCTDSAVCRLAWREALARLDLPRLLELLGPQPADAVGRALQQRLAALLDLS